MSRLVLGPFNRVEGDLEVTLDIQDDRVAAAWVNSPLYRGFEQILQGRAPLDALVITPRICGICSVSQSAAAALTLADAMGLERPANGQRALNLIQAGENLADHFTHFYLFFMPDFAREIYRDRPWYPAIRERFLAVKGSAGPEALEARARWFHLLGTLAGRWPHTLTFQPGGSTRAVTASERLRLLGIIQGFRRFLEQVTFGDTLEAVTALSNEQELAAWAGERDWNGSDFTRFLHLSRDLQLEQLGPSRAPLMSYGAYPLEGRPLLAPGVWDGVRVRELDTRAITEDISHSWLRGFTHPVHPADSITQPDADAEDGYSWCKAPRLDGRVVEVGALARQCVDGQPLIRDLVAASGGNVRNRVIARLLELARVVPAMEGWIRGLVPNAPYCEQGVLPEEADGVGLVEAARGSLGHWLEVRNGRILNYQIVAPTTWNFSPRDQDGVPGVLEQALVGAPVRPGETTPVAVQHVVRSFDPCMVCTVH